MGKKAKEHRKKIAKRNEAIKVAKKQYEKKLNSMKDDFMKQMIEKEKSEGKFDSNPNIPGINGPSIGFDGPSI